MGTPKPLTFKAAISGLSTGKPLAKEGPGELTLTVRLECSAYGVSLDRLKRLQKAGLLEIVMQTTEPEFPATAEDDDHDGD